MKTKLLIILFLGLTVTGFGQIVNDSMIKFHHGPTAKLYIDNTGFDPNVVPDTYIALNILHLWDHYKTDCYNDSTVSYYYTLCDWDCWDVPCNKGETILMDQKCPEHWEHKSPNNLSRFMNWIEKKYKTK